MKLVVYPAVEANRLLQIQTAAGEMTVANIAEETAAVEAIQDADAILWVADAQSGVLPDDTELARTLRRTAKPVTLAVNKIDVPAHQVRTAEFHALGFDHLAGVSAELVRAIPLFDKPHLQYAARQALSTESD